MPVSCSPYPTWVEVNLSAIEENCRFMAERAGTALMVVVKANAYGHGAVKVAETVLSCGASWLAVARFTEAQALRQAGIRAPILVFGMVTPSEADAAVAEGVSGTVYNQESADLLAQRARAAGRVARVHLKIDTGLGRLGVLPDDAPALAEYIRSLDGIELEGVYSHFAMMDEGPHPMNSTQLSRFQVVLNSLSERGIHPPWVHLANSVGAMDYPETRFNLVRTGSSILGFRLLPDEPVPVELRRALVWKAQLASCKLYPKGWGVGYGLEYITPEEEWIGVLPLGYSDGFRRVPGNRVLIGGQVVPVVGRLAMDMGMVRLPHAYPQGEEVVITGVQGDAAIQLEDLADAWNTTEMDVTSQINFRVPRIYIRD